MINGGHSEENDDGGDCERFCILFMGQNTILLSIRMGSK